MGNKYRSKKGRITFNRAGGWHRKSRTIPVHVQPSAIPEEVEQVAQENANEQHEKVDNKWWVYNFEMTKLEWHLNVYTVYQF